MTCNPVVRLHKNIEAIGAKISADNPGCPPLLIQKNKKDARLCRCRDSVDGTEYLKFRLEPDDQWSGDKGSSRKDNRHAERIELSCATKIKPGQQFKVSYELRLSVSAFIMPFPERLICGQLLRSDGPKSSPVCSFRVGYPAVKDVTYTPKVAARIHSHYLIGDEQQYHSHEDMTGAWKFDKFNRVELCGYWPANDQADLFVRINDDKKTIKDGLQNPGTLPAFFKFGIYHNEDAERYDEWKWLTGKNWPDREADYRNIEIEIDGIKNTLEIGGFQINE